jgi:hypothetical protein
MLVRRHPPDIRILQRYARDGFRAIDRHIQEVQMSSSDDFFVAEGPAAIGFRAENLKDIAPVFDFGVKAVGRTIGVLGQAGDTPAAPGGLFAGVLGTALDQPGVIGWSRTSDGVQGASFTAAGVNGVSFHGTGVRGLSGNLGMHGSGTEAGIVGESDSGGFGLVGRSGQFGPGHMGPVTGSSAVLGTSAVNPGVAGSSGAHIGVYGQSNQAGPPVPNQPVAGVFGSSADQSGVIGTSTTQIGVFGFSTNNVGVFGQTMNPASFAGAFAGSVLIDGNLTASGTKAAAVPFPDGTRRLLYCMESPELWFEDFGTAKLKNGRATAKLDGDFAKVIKPAGYHVFLTPEGDCRGLYIKSRRSASFEVRELQGGTSNVAFSYRVVGRRKDIKAHKRFAKVDLRPPKPPRAVRGRQQAPSPAIRTLLDTLKERGPTIDPARTRRRSRRGA